MRRDRKDDESDEASPEHMLRTDHAVLEQTTEKFLLLLRREWRLAQKEKEIAAQ
jgi:hypothetical protein